MLAIKWANDNVSKYGFDKKALVLGDGSAEAMAVLYAAYVSPQKMLPVKAVVNLWGQLRGYL